MANWSFIIPTLILLAGVVNDIKSRKITNPLILALGVIGLLSSILLNGGMPGFYEALLGGGAAFLLAVPLYITRVFGGGDLKLLVAFGFAAHWNHVLGTLLASLFWGAMLGLIRATLSGQLKMLIYSTFSVAKRRGTLAEDLHKIPYSFALLIGWLTQTTLDRLPEGVLW